MLTYKYSLPPHIIIIQLPLLFAVILTGPQNQTVAPGEIVTFNCHARGNSVYWYINGHYADPQVYNEARGFTITNTEIPRPRDELEEHNNTITVEARPSNNNTLITCTASGFIHGQQDFREGRLIIAGVSFQSPLTVGAHSYFMHDYCINILGFVRLSTGSLSWPGCATC